MSSLKQSIFLVSVYLAAIFLLAQFDYSDSPIIDFAKYFYFAVMVAVPLTVFFPYTTRVNVSVPVILWGCVYFVMLQMLDRTVSAPNSTFTIILLEFVLLLIGVWLAYQLANGISHAESILDAMAISAFPNRVRNINEASKQIKLEITRSRRYYRPLCLVVLSTEVPNSEFSDKLFLNIQHDLANRFSFARIGQVIDEYVRQTDMVFRDERDRFIVLCPETNHESSVLLAERISEVVLKKTGVSTMLGVAAFPDDALNFDDLMDVALSRLVSPKIVVKKQDSVETQIS
ncbi:MAG: diguanylate cyclase [Anaerolineales bacterium]|uniref:diguanylate cyclase domain-containing protein n=1 Tax=Candidatus Villigracilis vicinus TaxID=3140679 RepID=UPI00313691AC|nr:diguanylate cyclase [Anaerolineales bacterium]MBK7448569.1 diguanylate cyclase [Anaerolineales bacterium]MBK9782572.1 diguanylate cyclase [Anaerolineales bacterium]